MVPSRGKGRKGRQKIQSAPGQEFGAQARQERAQEVVPLPQEPGTSLAPVPPQGQPPAEVVPLDAASARPDEPVTAGMAMGPGAGPEALGALAPGAPDPELNALEGIYMAFPSEDLRRTLEIAQRRARPADEGAI